MENRKKAERILAALDSCRAPITWHCIDEDEIIGAIARELDRIDREERHADISMEQDARVMKEILASTASEKKGGDRE